MPPIRVKRAKKGTLFIRKPRVKRSAEQTSPAGSTQAHDPEPTPVPHGSTSIARRPLALYRLAKAKLEKKHRKDKLIDSLQKRIDALVSNSAANPDILNPTTILAWLASEEPVNTEFLLEHADHVAAEPGKVDPKFEAELDHVIERFNKSQILHISPEHENFTVEVPKGYAVALAPWAVDKHQYNIPMQNQPLLKGEDLLFKPFGATPRPPAPPEVGFDPVEMMKHAAIQFGSPETPKFSSLANDIHPIFRPENFHGCPQYIYEVLRPGLQLATQFLTSKATAHHWHTLLYGDRVPIPWLIGGTNYVRIPNPVPITPGDSQSFAALLSEVAVSSIHFTFEEWPSHQKGQWFYGVMEPIKDYKNGFAGFKATPGARGSARLTLHSDFYITAKKLSILKSPDPAMLLRFHLFFAINLVHEVAHFLEMSSEHTRFTEVDLKPYIYIKSYSVEPLMYDYTFSEMGGAFETRLFGGRIKPISLRTDCVHGLTVYDEESLIPDPNPEAMKTREYHSIPMEWISWIQQQSTWDRAVGYAGGEEVEGGVEKWRAFHVPRDGAKALQVPYFDMTVWNDEMDGKVVSDNGMNTAFRRRWKGVDAQP